MPVGFEYADVFAKGQPKHQVYDSFWADHPPMDQGHRAKIFAPFDALDGFDEAISAKDVLYEFRRELSEDEKNELNRRIGILHSLTQNTRMARENQIIITVTYYVPCKDKESFSYGYRGQYVQVSGICWGLDMSSIQVDDAFFPLDDIVSIESDTSINERNIFDTGWETDSP